MPMVLMNENYVSAKWADVMTALILMELILSEDGGAQPSYKRMFY